MAQQTALSVTATPGKTQTFAAKLAGLIADTARTVTIIGESRTVESIGESRTVESIGESRTVTTFGESRTIEPIKKSA